MEVNIQFVGNWVGLARIARTMVPRFKRAIRSAVLEEAKLIRKFILAGIASQAPGGQAFTPISPLTRALRKVLGGSGRRALWATGGLRRGVDVKDLSGSDVRFFVGIHRSAKGAKGKSLASIGAIHEYGATIRRTEKMTRFLHAVMRKAGVRSGGHVAGLGRVFKDKNNRWRNSKGKFLSGAQLAAAKAAEAARGGKPKAGQPVIRIPARPFIGPVLAKYAKPSDVKARILARVAKAMDGDLGKSPGTGILVS